MKPDRSPRSRWVAALLIAGALAWTACYAAEVGDIQYKRKAEGTDDIPPAIFPHWIHRMQYKCQACHDTPFKMKAGENLVTMDEIQAGQWCGACHDGKAAFISNLSTCNRCHRE